MTRTSNGGENYRCLERGSTVEFNYVDYGRHDNLGTVGGFETHHIYLTCQELKEKYLPIDANPREPSNSRIVKSMQETLRDDAESFVKWNNGITVVCENVNKGSGTVELEFSEEDEGICNGGHTYFAIVTSNHDVSNSGVLLEVIEVPQDLDNREEEIVEIAKKRNNINNLDNYTVADFLDLYEPFKQRMDDPEVVSWHENDSEAKSYAVSAPEVIRMMTTVNPTRYRHAILCPGGSYHKSAATSKTSLHTSWFEDALEARDNDNEDPMAFLGVLIDDLFEIRDMIAYSFKEGDYDNSFRKRSFYQDNIGGEDATTRDLHMGDYDGLTGYKIRSTLEVMVLGMFRSNLFQKYDEDGNVRYVGWMVEPKTLWDEEKERVVDNLSTFYDDVGKSYRDFINSEAPYREELYEFGRSASWPFPPAEILYDTESADKYVFTEDTEDATHWLADSGEGLISISDRERPDDEPLYKVSN
ncbi:AIPR family protein [Halosimplex halophilum]|uniref:AIPR family protein n=1 Tax=Halosimplex halophilum TaxID=2559572 RepID=UPI0014355A4D|nr:AIPR family protein [Halosimplex halophilum]